MSKKLDATDLKVKELLGINPYPNKCVGCGLKSTAGQPYQITSFEINILDGNVYCSKCHQPIKFGRINNARMHKRMRGNYKMVKLRRKKKKPNEISNFVGASW